MFPPRKIVPLAVQAIATVACSENGLAPLSPSASYSTQHPLLPPSSPSPSPPPSVWTLTGSCALNLYIPPEHALDPSDIDFLVVVDTSHIPLHSVHPAMVSVAERAVRRVNDIMSRVLSYPSSPMGPWISHRLVYHCNTSAFTCNLFCMGTKVGDLTLIELADDNKVSSLFPRLVVPVMIGTTSMPMSVCSSEELLYRIRCTLYNTGTADGLLPGEDNQWRVVKDFKRLSLFDTFNGLARHPRPHWVVGQEDRGPVDVSKFFPEDSMTPVWSTRRRVLALDVDVKVAVVQVSPGPVPVLMVPASTIPTACMPPTTTTPAAPVPLMPVATTIVLLTRMCQMTTTAMDAFSAAVFARLDVARVDRVKVTLKTAVARYNKAHANHLRNRVKSVKQELTRTHQGVLRRTTASYQAQLVKFSTAATEAYGKFCNTLHVRIGLSVSKIETKVRALRSRLEAMETKMDASCMLYARLSKIIDDMTVGLQQANERCVELSAYASRMICSLCSCMKSVHVNLFNTSRRVEQYGKLLVSKAKRASDVGLFPFALFQNAFNIPLNADGEVKGDVEDMTSSIQDGLLSILVGAMLSTMQVMHASRTPDAPGSGSGPGVVPNSVKVAGRGAFRSSMEMVAQLSKVLQSLGSPAVDQYWLPVFSENGIFAVPHSTTRKGVSQPSQGDVPGQHITFLEMQGAFCFSAKRMREKLKVAGGGEQDGAAGAAGAGLGSGTPVNSGMEDDAGDMFLQLPMEPHVAEGVVGMLESVSAFLLSSFTECVLETDDRHARAMEAAMTQGLVANRKICSFLAEPLAKPHELHPQAMFVLRLLAANLGLPMAKIHRLRGGLKKENDGEEDFLAGLKPKASSSLSSSSSSRPTPSPASARASVASAVSTPAEKAPDTPQTEQKAAKKKKRNKKR